MSPSGPGEPPAGPPRAPEEGATAQGVSLPGTAAPAPAHRQGTVHGGRSRARRRVSFVVVGVGVVGLVVGLLAGSGTGQPRSPHFSFPRLGGGPPVAYPLSGGQAGHAVVLSFFASWCSPCRTELPTIAKVADAAHGRASTVVFVGIDGNDDPASGLAFARRSGVRFAVGADHDSALAPRFGLIGYPDTVFIGASGAVEGVVRGPVTRAELLSWMNRLSSA
jgi:thiol-disulfide isomerase/thioredoxin